MERRIEISELHYDIVVGRDDAGIEIRRRGARDVRLATDSGELIFELEADLVVQLQLRRRDLLYVHAAVLELQNEAHMLVGRSGAGKSTTSWGLLHHGFSYVSDELAPIDVDSACVLAYTHALCMKREPPPAHALPQDTITTSRGFHVPVSSLPFRGPQSPLRLRSMIFVEYDDTLRRSKLTPISHAEATARLYSNVLNGLAHSDGGMSAVARLTRDVARYKLDSASLAESCECVTNALGLPREI